MEREDYLGRPCTLVDAEFKTIWHCVPVRDFRDIMHTVSDGEAPQHAGSTGRVYTDRGHFFPSVVNCKWVPTALLEARAAVSVAKYHLGLQHDSEKCRLALLAAEIRLITAEEDA